MRAQERVGLARFEVTEGTRENRCAGTTNASDSCFTGKEEDIDVGLTYFGKRYLSPYLNRWISPDPLAVHAFGADLNVYAYVNARVLAAVDPLGLEPASWWLASQATRRAILAEAAASGNPLAELVVGAGVLGFELGNAAGEHLYGDKIKAAEARAAEEKRRIAELKRQINATKQKLAAQRAKNRGLEAKLKASKTAVVSRAVPPLDCRGERPRATGGFPDCGAGLEAREHGLNAGSPAAAAAGLPS